MTWENVLKRKVEKLGRIKSSLLNYMKFGETYYIDDLYNALVQEPYHSRNLRSRYSLASLIKQIPEIERIPSNEKKPHYTYKLKRE